MRDPKEIAEREINAFLTNLALKDRVSASTQTQALSAIVFLYRHVLRREIGVLDEGRAERIRHDGEASWAARATVLNQLREALRSRHYGR